MKNRLLGLLLCSAVVVYLAGCVKSAEIKKPSAPLRSVAVISIAVNATRAIEWSVRNQSVQELVDGTLAGMIKETEKKLAGIVHVSKISGFVDDPVYRNAGVKSTALKKDEAYITPHVSGKHMVLFSDKDDDVENGELKPEVARKLCAELKVDAVVLIYSEWTRKVGHFVPLTKGNVENVVTVWDRRGERVFKKSAEVMGENTIGAMGLMAVNSDTIKEWSMAYGKSLDEIFTELKTLTR